jgi:hypothetical protein
MFITLASYHSPDAYVTSTVQNNSIAIHWEHKNYKYTKKSKHDLSGIIVYKKPKNQAY